MARDLKNGDWLGDDHVYLAQELIRKQFPHIDGLQSTLLCQNDGFIPIQAEGMCANNYSTVLLCQCNDNILLLIMIRCPTSSC